MTITGQVAFFMIHLLGSLYLREVFKSKVDQKLKVLCCMFVYLIYAPDLSGA